MPYSCQANLVMPRRQIFFAAFGLTPRHRLHNFGLMRVRPAFKAGSWYPASASVLRRELAVYLRQARGEESEAAVGGIVPHAGLAYSGPVAAEVYARLASCQQKIEAFIIFGAVHTMHLCKPAVWPTGAWQTPLGALAIDDSLADAIVAADIADAAESPHLGDNAIELQTPFLKYVFPEARIVPIAVPANDMAALAGTAIWEIVEKSGCRAIALGSTDLTHYGDTFGYTPAGSGKTALAWVRRNDRKLLELMARLAAEEIVPTADRDHSACGAGAAAAATAFARAAGCQKGIILAQTTSYDLMPDGVAAHFVGYGAVIFPQAKA